MISDWLAFWDSRHFLYGNARHKDVHYRLVAQAIAALVPSGAARVLDYGAGEALHADVVAEAAGELLLCEAAPGLRAGLEKRFAGHSKIRVVAPHEIARLPEHSLDLIVMHAVAQYLTAAGTGALFALFHRLLKPGGLLVVGDVMRPEDLGGDRRLGAAAIWQSQRLFLCRAVGASSHPVVGLLAPALADWPDALCRSHHDRKTRRRRLRGGARAGQYRPQPGAHDVLRAAG